jgi:hypothetical protein
LLGAVLKEVVVAFDADGDQDLGFCLGRGHVEGYAVEIRDNLID